MRSDEDDAAAVTETKERATLIDWLTKIIAKAVEEVRELIKRDE